MARNPRVAERRASLFEATVLRIAEDPQQFALMEMRRNPGNIRRARIRGFPLLVVYCVHDNDVEVIAVPHTSQRPVYWKSRLSD
jgi:plasmid stabilization system protein ParE